MSTALGAVAEAADNVELTLWVNGWPQKALDGIKKVADLFAQENPTVKSVTVLPVSQSQHMEKLTLAVASDTAPDVVTLTAPFIQHVMNGLLQPIDPFLEKSRLVKRSDYPPFMLQTFSVDGRVYGLPAIEAGPGSILVYNRELFANAGLPDAGPATLEDLYQAHKKLTRVDPANNQLTQLGINPLDSMGGTYFPEVWSTLFNVKWYDPATRQLNLLAFEPAVEFIKRIYDTPSYAQVSRFSGQIGGWTGGVASGKLAMQINGYWVPGELKSIGSKLDIGYTWIPSADGERALAVLPWGMGIPSNAKHPDLSFQLIEFFATPRAAQIMFDAVGWLNGNLTSMRRLNVRELPVVAQIIGMFDQASRITAPIPMPINDQVRYGFGGALGPVWRNEQASRAVLTNYQNQMQQRLNEVLSRLPSGK